MDSESKELLREWLVRSLEPVCDADPEVLSKYVLALIQNDPHKEELPDTCIAKLEEFLGDETTAFVSRLFKALETGSYKTNEDDQRKLEDGEEQQEHEDDANRRRSRHGSDDEDERRRYSKRRREYEDANGHEYDRHAHQHPVDDRRYSPHRDARRQPFAQRGGRHGPPFSGRGGDRGYGGPMDRRREFSPEWGMRPPPMGMWPYPPPRGGGGAGFPPHPDFDPNMYNPENPAMLPPPGMMMPPPRHMGYYPPHHGGRGGRGRGGRGAGRGDGMKDDGAGEGSRENVGARTTLRVSNVDPKYVNMTKLSLHFSKFGNVVNVQMRPNVKCAYVQYATEEEAKKAFHSPIPVCNNRFIEVKWAKYDAKDPEGAPPMDDQATTVESKENDGNAPTETTDADDAIPEKDMTPEELRAAALEKGRKVLEEKRELLEKQKQLMKQKEELLKRQLAQQKEILERMSQNSANVSLEDKRELLNKITALSEELKSLQRSVAPVVVNREENISGLKAELSALEAQTAVTPPFAGGRGGRGGRGWTGGRGYYRGGGRGGRGGRGFAMAHHTLDNRTTIVKVENLPEQARDASVLEQHFGNFGLIEKVILDDKTPSQGYIKFQDRYAGQAALSHGKNYGETELEMHWVEPQEAPAALTKRPEEAATEATKSETPSTEA